MFDKKIDKVLEKLEVIEQLLHKLEGEKNAMPQKKEEVVVKTFGGELKA